MTLNERPSNPLALTVIEVALWVLLAVAATCFALACLPTARGQTPTPSGKSCVCSPACTCGCNDGLPCRCGNPPPTPATPADAADADLEARGKGKQNFGVVESELGKCPTGRPCYKLNGQYVTREQAVAAVEGKDLPNDRDKLRLTIIGSEADRKRVLADLDRPELAALKALYVVQAYPPDHWAVKEAGFVCEGSPVVYLQRPDGTVLHKQTDARGPEQLAQAIRRADPAYDPKLDPDLNAKPKTPEGGTGLSGVIEWAKSLPGWVWIAAAGGAFLWLNSRSKT